MFRYLNPDYDATVNIVGTINILQAYREAAEKNYILFI